MKPFTFNCEDLVLLTPCMGISFKQAFKKEGDFMPYEVGEYVIYSSLGICQVVENDAHVSLAGDENELYYILAPLEKRLGKAYVPHSRSFELRYTLDKDEALSALDKVSELEPDDYQDTNSHLVQDHFRELIRSNDFLSLLLVCKSMHARIAEQEQKKHSASLTYKKLLNDAQSRIYGELSVVLDMEVDDVPQFIEDYLAEHSGGAASIN